MSVLSRLPSLSSRQRYALRLHAPSLLLVPVAAVFAQQGGSTGLGRLLWMLVSAFNLIVHESGHFFFRFFGRFMEIAGATIMELGMPALFVFQGIYWHSRVGTQLALLWLGQAFVGVSVYAADAQARALPLIGNLGPEAHDWGNMLTMLGLLEHTSTIAGALYACAFICWGVMLLVPLRIT
jgi:hypothetical protein